MKRGHEGTTLTDAVRLWPTPDAAAWAGGNRSESEGAAERPALEQSARRWTTPVSGVHGQPGPGSRHVTLLEQANMWATPVRADGERTSLGMFRGREGNPTLLGQAQGWATPQARDWRAETGEYRPDHFPTLGRQVRQTETVGETRSSSIRRLNPLFVEWLMGLPRGWTASEPSATAWSPWWRRMRSALSRLAPGSAT
jgi:hypothetical protein